MKLKQRILYRCSGSHALEEGVVEQFAGPGDKFVCLSGQWREAGLVTVLCELPQEIPTEPTKGQGKTTVPVETKSAE